MKKEIISNALSNIDDTYIEEAANYSIKKKKYRYFLLPTAACFFLVLLATSIYFININKSVDNVSVESDDYIILHKGPAEENKKKDYSYGIDLPKVHTEIDPYAEISYYPYIEYESRMYGYYATVDNTSNLLGNKLGYAIGCIDKNGKPTGSNSTVIGDFHLVNGYNSDFMLCMISNDNKLDLFIHDNGFRISYGEEIFEDKLHVSERYDSIYVQTRNDWYYDREKQLLNQEVYPAMDEYLELINNSKWIFSEPVIGNKMEDYHLFYNLEDGLIVHLRLYKDGYIGFDGVNAACLQIDKKDMATLLDLLES